MTACRCYRNSYSLPEKYDLLYLRDLLTIPGVVTIVVHKDDLPDEVLGAPVEHTHDRPQQGGAGLVVEGDDDGGSGEGAGHLTPVLGPTRLAPSVGHIAVTGYLVTGLLKQQRRC